MPLLKPIEKNENVSFRITVSKKIADEMKSYCEWADIKKSDHFIEQAIQLVFDKDKDWQKVDGIKI